MKKLEENKLIAEFMGYSSEDGYFDFYNWETLMPVIQKLGSIQNCFVNFDFRNSNEEETCGGTEDDPRFGSPSHSLSLYYRVNKDGVRLEFNIYENISAEDKPLLDIAWESIVKFIKWYNLNIK